MKISFLTGSGFSIPYGLPKVAEINAKYSSLEPQNLYIAGNQRAFLQKEKIDENGHLKWDENLFVSGFLKFYNKTQTIKEFDYEDFFDYFLMYLENKSNQEVLEEFCNDFELTNNFQKLGARTRIRDFQRTYSQLIAESLIRKEFQEELYNYHLQKYSQFMQFVKSLAVPINFHSLNHDLLMDNLGRCFYESEYCDGFHIAGSPVYGILEKNFNVESPNINSNQTYYVKLKHFTDTFSGRFNLFKLHGGINNYYVYYNKGANSELYQSRYGVGDIFIEKKDFNGNYEMEYSLDMVEPNFISGKIFKTEAYKKHTYFTKMISHFEKNLENCDKLVVIGYGFKDDGINRIIENLILKKSKELIVFDIVKNCEVFAQYFNLKYEIGNFINLKKEDFGRIILN